MINLLSRSEQKKNYQEYLLRIGTLLFLVLSIAGIVLIATLVPSYFRVKSDVQAATDEHSEKLATVNADDDAQLGQAKEFLAEVQVLRSSSSTVSIVDLFQGVISAKPSGVGIRNFQFDYNQKGQTLTMQGKASEREDILAFKSALERDPRVKKVDLPTQALIKRTDIDFTMTITLGPPTSSTQTSTSTRPASSTDPI